MSTVTEFLSSVSVITETSPIDSEVLLKIFEQVAEKNWYKFARRVGIVEGVYKRVTFKELMFQLHLCVTPHDTVEYAKVNSLERKFVELFINSYFNHPRRGTIINFEYLWNRKPEWLELKTIHREPLIAKSDYVLFDMYSKEVPRGYLIWKRHWENKLTGVNDNA